MNILDIYNAIGSIICHQIRSRSLVLDGMPLPLCARDTGLYMGVFIATLYIVLRRRIKADMPPKIYMTVALCLFMLPLILDGLSSYVGIRTTTNAIRLFTGAFCGMGLPFFILPAAHFKIGEKNTVNILEKWWEIPLLSVIISAVCIITLKAGFPWLVISTIIIFSFVLLVFMIIYTVLARIKNGTKKYILWMAAGITVAALGVVYAIKNTLL